MDSLDASLANHPRTKRLDKMKKIRNDLFLIIVPGFFTNESFDFDIHYCVESPQFGDDDFVRLCIAEKAVEHFSFDSDGDGFTAVTVNRCIFCCDDYKVVEIEPQIIYSPNM